MTCLGIFVSTVVNNCIFRDDFPKKTSGAAMYCVCEWLHFRVSPGLIRKNKTEYGIFCLFYNILLYNICISRCCREWKVLTYGMLLQFTSYAVPCAIKIVTMCIPHAVNWYSVCISDRLQHLTISLNISFFLGFHSYSCFLSFGRQGKTIFSSFVHFVQSLLYWEGSIFKNMSWLWGIRRERQHECLFSSMRSLLIKKKKSPESKILI